MTVTGAALIRGEQVGDPDRRVAPGTQAVDDRFDDLATVRSVALVR
jgi:hypothetical protein